MPRVEFTIEPFNEGQPGRHVTAPADTLRALDVEVLDGRQIGELLDDSDVIMSF